MVYSPEELVACHRGWSPLRRDDYGPLWEHLVLNGLHAARQRRDVQYGRTKTGHEVDFVVGLAQIGGCVSDRLQ